jgi:hypothetical protein
MWRAAGLVAVAVAVGCGPGKELPSTVPHPKVPPGPPPDPFGPAPAASDSDAKEVLERAVKAITGNVPGGVKRAEVSRVNRAGKFQTLDRPQMSDATNRLDGVWPDRGYAQFDFDGQSVTCRFREGQGWLTQGTDVQNQNPAEMARIFRADFHARHWIPLGLTLADDKTVAFGKASADGKTAVRIAVAGLPVFLVTFDDKTGLPVRVEYHGVENKQTERAHKVCALDRHDRPYGGYVLPTVMKLYQNGRLVEDWTTKEWDFPEKLDDALFDPPK